MPEREIIRRGQILITKDNKMRLIVLRHAEAFDHAASDFARRLTPKGREQAARAGSFLRDHGLEPQHILCSPYLRARETALVATAQLRLPEGSRPHPGAADSEQDRLAEGLIREEKELGCGMRPESALALLRHLPESDTVLLVGHQPDCSIFAAHLTGTHSSGAFNFKKACSAVFELERFCSGGATLEAFLPVKLLGTPLP